MSEKQLAWYELPAKRWKNDPNGFLERDSQRQKLYDAQVSAKWKCLPLDHQLPSIEAIQRYVNWLTSEVWFIKRFGQHSITVKSKKGYGASARKGDSTTWFSSYSRNILTILHEVAHIVKKSGAGSAHGRFFARTLLELVEHVVGKEEAKILKEEFKRHRVKYLPKRELSEETREKLRQSFVNNVLKQKVRV